MESGDSIQVDQPRKNTNYQSNYSSLKQVETVRFIKWKLDIMEIKYSCFSKIIVQIILIRVKINNFSP